MNAIRSPLCRLATLTLVALGCAAVREPLGPEALSRLRRPVSDHGELVYVGDVVPYGASRPAFRYERRVRPDASGGSQVSTHVTLSPEGAPVLTHRATHSPDYRLVRFDEINEQLGQVTELEVRDDGSLVFTSRRGADVETRVEGPGAPVVVGPTLFGYVRAHFAELRAGGAHAVRFAVADRARTYDFELRARHSSTHETTVDMVAANFFVRLGIDPIRIVFDERTENPISYHGRVPPRLEGGRPFDANIRYKYAAPGYQ